MELHEDLRPQNPIANLQKLAMESPGFLKNIPPVDLETSAPFPHIVFLPLNSSATLDRGACVTDKEKGKMLLVDVDTYMNTKPIYV